MSRLIMPSILNQGVEGGKVFIASMINGTVHKYESGQWSNISPVSSNNYRVGGISDDGKKWIIPVYGGRLYLWNGTQYVEQQPLGNNNANWYFANISGDGKRMIAGIYGGRIYYSDGSGWGEVQPGGNANYNWTFATMSFDGTKYMCCAEMGRVYYYNGSQFVEEQPYGNNTANWYALTVDRAGNPLVAGSRSWRIYEKPIGGSWGEVQPVGNLSRAWRNAFISTKGFKHYISGIAGWGFTYFYDGTNWIDEGIFNNYNEFVSGSMADNGKRIIAGRNSRLYINMHDGNGYVEHTPAGNSDQSWFHVMTNKGI